MRDDRVKLIEGIAGRQPITRLGVTLPGGRFATAPLGMSLGTNTSGVELFTPGVHGTAAGCDQWITYPG